MNAHLQQDVMIDVWDRPFGSTPAPKRLGFIPAATQLEYRRGLDHNEWARLTIPSNAVPAWINPTHIIRATVVGDVAVSGAFEEFRIERVIRERGFITVECRGLIDDLTSAGLVFSENDTDRVYTFTATKTVVQWVDFIHAFHQSRGHTYWQPGTVTPTNSVTIIVERMTATQLIQYITGGFAEIGLWEYGYRYDTAAGHYKFDIVASINSAATTLRVIGGQNIKQLVDYSRSEDLISGVIPAGVKAITAAAKSIARTLWKVQSLEVVPTRVRLVDLGGDSMIKPIQFDNQFNQAPYPVEMQCVRTGRRYPVVNTYLSDQSLGVASTLGLRANDVVELIYTPTSLVKTKMHWRTNTASTAGRLIPFRVGAINTGEARFQALVPGTAIVGTVIGGRNDGLDGLTLRRSTIATTNIATNFDTSTGILTVGSSLNSAVGRWGYLYNTSTNNWLYQGYNVVEVIDSTHIRIERRYECDRTAAWVIPNGALSTTGFVELAETADTYQITKHTGATNFGSDPQQNVWLTSVTNLVAGDIVEAYVEVGGQSVSELFSPTSLMNFPAVASNYEQRTRDLIIDRFGGDPSMLHFNGWCESNTDDVGAIWTPSITVAAEGEGINGPNVFRGLGSTAITMDTGQSSTADDLKSARILRLLVNPFADNTTGKLVIAARVKFNGAGQTQLTVLDLRGGVLAQGAAVLDTGAAFVTTQLVIDPTATGGSIFRVGGHLCGNGFKLQFTNTNGTLRVDAIAAYWAPDGLAKDDEQFAAWQANAKVWAKGNEYLALYHQPPRSLECTLADLYAMNRVLHSDKRVVLGAMAAVYNEETDTDLQARVTSVHTVFSPSVVSRLNIDVNTAEERLSQIIVAGGILS